jgi:hypothetical protein
MILPGLTDGLTTEENGQRFEWVKNKINSISVIIIIPLIFLTIWVILVI